jgi:hypothetical protein
MNLQSHLKKVHRAYAESDLKCSYCDENFDLPWLKRKHETIKHTKQIRLFKCKYEGCNKAFATSSKLLRHDLIHANMKQFQCSFDGCDRAFNRRDYLQNHVKSHRDLTVPFELNDKKGNNRDVDEG